MNLSYLDSLLKVCLSGINFPRLELDFKVPLGIGAFSGFSLIGLDFTFPLVGEKNFDMSFFETLHLGGIHPSFAEKALRFFSSYASDPYCLCKVKELSINIYD